MASPKSPTSAKTRWVKRSCPLSCPAASGHAAAPESRLMPDVEVHIDLDGETRRVGLLRRHAARRTETVTFEYDGAWLADRDRFSIEPALTLTRGVFPAPRNQAVLDRKSVV